MAATETAKSETKPDTAGTRDRSPSFPFIPLQTAIERLEAFEAYFGRHPGPPDKAGLAWGMKGKSSSADSTLAALKSYGLVDYQGSGSERQVVISDEGRKYLRAQQDSIKRDVLKNAALRPKAIAKFWNHWGADRPRDPVCLDDLILKHGFSDNGAQKFLKVYDATIAYAGFSKSDKFEIEEQEDEADDTEAGGENEDAAAHRAASSSGRTGAGQKVKIMDSERIVFTEEGSPNQYLKLVASGEVDDGLLEALEDFVKRQRKRLKATPMTETNPAPDGFQASVREPRSGRE